MIIYCTTTHRAMAKQSAPLDRAQIQEVLERKRNLVHIEHPERFRSNAQNANAFARRNRPRVEHNDEFACVYLRLRACVCIRL